MIVYDGLKSDFLRSVENDTIAIEIEANVRQKMGLHPSKNEFQSWNNSLFPAFVTRTISISG